MGFFGKKAAPADLTQSQLMIAIGISVSAADGEMDEDEIGVIVGLMSQLPKYQVADGDIDAAVKFLTANGLGSIIDKAVEALPVEDRKRALILAVEVACADGSIDDSEVEMIEDMAAKMSISDDDGEKILEVVQWKYM